MEGRCKTCRYWDRRTTNDDVRECTNPAIGERGRLRDNGCDLRADRLEYEYNEDGLIFTGPEFGCVHYIQADT
jgi:hypothetical protein